MVVPALVVTFHLDPKRHLVDRWVSEQKGERAAQRMYQCGNAIFGRGGCQVIVPIMKGAGARHEPGFPSKAESSRIPVVPRGSRAAAQRVVDGI